MKNYEPDHPFTILNEKAVVQAAACLDRDEKPFTFIIG